MRVGPSKWDAWYDLMELLLADGHGDRTLPASDECKCGASFGRNDGGLVAHLEDAMADLARRCWDFGPDEMVTLWALARNGFAGQLPALLDVVRAVSA